MASDQSPAGIDLHVHTTASDGSFSPLEVVTHARETGLAAISITDHDTVDGVREILSAGIPADLKFITGVELSSTSRSLSQQRQLSYPRVWH